MERYGWDMEHINRRQDYYKHLIEITADEQKREQYEDLFDRYSLLILGHLFSDGIPGREDGDKKLHTIDRMRIVQEVPNVDKYSSEVLRVKKCIIEKMQDLDMDLPYVQFSKSMNVSKLVKLIGEAIHDIFGDDAYNDYKKIAIDTTDRIQIGNSETQACMHYVKDGDVPDYYILLPRISNIMIVNRLSHEAGHQHRFAVNDIELLENHILGEYESFSYEIRVLDYFIKNGIYKREAVKAMIRIINMLDAFAGLFNELGMIESETAEEFTRKARKKDIYKRLRIPNNEVLLDYLYTIKSEYMFPYVYSAMCVFEHMQTDDNLEKYNTVIHEIGKTPEMDLVKKIVDNPEDINNLNGYREYRKEMKKIYKGE